MRRSHFTPSLTQRSFDGLADSKTFKRPRRPFEKERLDNELRLVGEYGLRCKRELWRVQMTLSRIRNSARTLLTLDEKEPKRIFEGRALMRRMYKYGLLDENQDKLDYVLALTPQHFLDRRLQTLVQAGSGEVVSSREGPDPAKAHQVGGAQRVGGGHRRAGWFCKGPLRAALPLVDSTLFELLCVVVVFVAVQINK